MNYIASYASPFDELTIITNETDLLYLCMDGQRYYTDIDTTTPICAKAQSDEPAILTQTRRWLDRYFAGEKPTPDELNLKPAGSPFRQLIWQFLCEIPYGETVTYGDLAKKAADLMGKKKMSAQAVGGAVGHNPISIIIPCHRVIGTGGNLTGFGGGIHKKIQLLTFEGVDMTPLFIPKKGTAL